jgi:hypothetical protein
MSLLKSDSESVNNSASVTFESAPCDGRRDGGVAAGTCGFFELDGKKVAGLLVTDGGRVPHAFGTAIGKGVGRDVGRVFHAFGANVGIVCGPLACVGSAGNSSLTVVGVVTGF